MGTQLNILSRSDGGQKYDVPIYGNIERGQVQQHTVIG